MISFKAKASLPFLLVEVTKIALAAFDHAYLVDELKYSIHQTNFQMFFLFKLYGNFSMDTSEEISAQGN
jgi:hypothetical protein